MFTREQFLEAVLSYEGTPYQHQGRIKHVAIDCIGLIVCPMRDLGEDMSYIPNNYGANANPRILLKHLYDTHHAFKVENGDLEPGDILVFTNAGSPRHFGVYLGDRQMIHSYFKQNVLITDYDVWKILLHSVWRLKFDGVT